MSFVNEVGRLRAKEFNGYLRFTLPHELDAAVESVVETYRRSSKSVRAQMLNDLSPRAADVLCVFGQRAAAMAVRTRSVAPLYRALVAMGMADARVEDAPWNLASLAAVNHSADLLGWSLAALLDTTGPDLPTDALAAFRDFDARQPRDKSLQAMNLRVTGSSDTFLYT